MGHLASIHSQGASRVLAAYLESQSHATGNVWIGLLDEEHVSDVGLTRDMGTPRGHGGY